MQEVSNDLKGIVNVPAGSGMIATHNTDPMAHPDIREALKEDKSAQADIRKKMESLEKTLTQQEIKRRKVTLTTQGWSAEEKTQTVTVTGVSAKETDQLIIPVPALANREAYQEAGIQTTAQEADRVTFTAWSVPKEDLTVFVAIIPYGGGADK